MKINEPMRQFLIDRSQTLYYEALKFPKTRRVAENWICRALRLARRAGDMELYWQISHSESLYGTKTKKDNLPIAKGRKTELRMDSRAFLDAARAVLMDSQGIAKGRISNDALFTAIEARLGVEKLPRRAWAKHLSSLGLKPAKWSSGVRGWRLPDATVDATVDATKSEPPAGRPKCRVRLPNPEAAGYTTKEALLEAVEKYPHLRPCPKKDWWWLEWKYCERCDWKLPVPVADLSPAASGPAIAS